MWMQVISERREAHLDPHWCSACQAHSCKMIFFFNSATFERSLEFWKLSVSGLDLAACKSKHKITRLKQDRMMQMSGGRQSRTGLVASRLSGTQAPPLPFCSIILSA